MDAATRALQTDQKLTRIASDAQEVLQHFGVVASITEIVTVRLQHESIPQASLAHRQLETVQRCPQDPKVIDGVAGQGHVLVCR